MTASSSRLTPADVREIVRLLRVNGWRHRRSWREFGGDLLRVNIWHRGEQLIEAIFVTAGELVSLNYMDVDTDDSLWSACNTGILNRAGRQGLVDLMAAFGILPNHFSSVYNAAFAEGMASLKDVVVSSAVDAELDQRCARLKEAAPDLVAEHGHLLRAEGPYDQREAMAAILDSAWEVVDADL